VEEAEGKIKITKSRGQFAEGQTLKLEILKKS
jgi:hypothetical protein